MNVKMPSTKADYVCDVIKKDILDGRFPPGKRLRLAELASLYQTSEMPIREALFMLRRDGLVSFKSHCGATVAEVSIKELCDIIATGTYLEILAMTEAVSYHTESTISVLTDLNDQMKKTKVGSKYSELNREFHRLLCSPCKNEFLKGEINDIVARFFKRWPKTIFELRPERKALATKEHEAMLEALRAGSASRLHKMAMTHREETLKAWQDVVEEAESKTTKPSKLAAV
ncbi:GntR family transcriptional regulator [Bradyrhizobium cenepequi]|uniref:GntR family transcriptional regulator n=1 Tax=Bradyrhizobium cenepequi TaxID=2821403 RepID=UPI001CE23FD0|nr:GntR family transcriptional regulator [Bradyrhizobium cenepequi]MCA6112215.1 GntR family transcriptional regulator [Bradyrhizobium cenepequi]